MLRETGSGRSRSLIYLSASAASLSRTVAAMASIPVACPVYVTL